MPRSPNLCHQWLRLHQWWKWHRQRSPQLPQRHFHLPTGNVEAKGRQLQCKLWLKWAVRICYRWSLVDLREGGVLVFGCPSVSCDIQPFIRAGKCADWGEIEHKWYTALCLHMGMARIWLRCLHAKHHYRKATPTPLAGTYNRQVLTKIRSGIRTCRQTTPNFVVPVEVYERGGIIGFGPMDINGNPVPSCPELTRKNPIIIDIENCTHMPWWEMERVKKRYIRLERVKLEGMLGNKSSSYPSRGGSMTQPLILMTGYLQDQAAIEL